jgi:hypothetical protein
MSAPPPAAAAAKPPSKPPAFGFRAGFLLGGGGGGGAATPTSAPAPKPAPKPVPAVTAAAAPAPLSKAARTAFNAGRPLVALLETPGLAGELLSLLTLREATALRGTCSAAVAAVAAHPFAPPFINGLDKGVLAGWEGQMPIFGGRNLARFLAAFPAAVSVVVCDASSEVAGLGVRDEHLARVTGRKVLSLVDCGAITAAGFSHLTGLEVLTVEGRRPLLCGPMLAALPDPGALRQLVISQDHRAFTHQQRIAGMVGDAHVGRFPRLQALSADCWNLVTRAGLAKLPELKTLALSVCGFLAPGEFEGLPSRIAALTLKFDSLPDILNGLGGGGGGAAAFGGLLANANAELDARRRVLRAPVLAPLAPSLRSLILVNAVLPAVADNPLAPLTGLESLTISGVLSDGATDELLASTPLPPQLSFERHPTVTFGPDAAAAHHRVRTLVVADCPSFTGGGAALLPDLRHFIFAGEFWADPIIHSITGLINATHDFRNPSRLELIELNSGGTALPPADTHGLRAFRERGSVTTAFRERGWAVMVDEGTATACSPTRRAGAPVLTWVAWRDVPGGTGAHPFRGPMPPAYAVELARRAGLPVPTGKW